MCVLHRKFLLLDSTGMTNLMPFIQQVMEQLLVLIGLQIK